MAYILSILQTVLLVILITSLTILIAGGLRRAVYTLMNRHMPTLASFSSNVVQLLILLAGLALIIYAVGIDTAVILTIVAIFTAGVSLALDGSVRDLIATTKLVTFGYYKIGDIVTLAGHSGEVVDITAFSTILETPIRDRVIIANKEIVDTIILNHTATNTYEVAIQVPIGDLHDRSQVTTLLMRVAHDCPDRLIGATVEPYILHELMPDYEKYTLAITTENNSNRLKIASWMSLEAANQLNACGIRTGRVVVNRT